MNQGLMDWETRTKVIQGLQAAVPADGDGSFFNRRAELRALLARLTTPPVCVTVAVGPTDCGKTKLLKRLKKIWLSNEELAATSPVFYFDMRKQVWSTPQDAAAHVQRKFWRWTDVFKKWAENVKRGLAGVTVKKGGVDIPLKVVTELLPAFEADTRDLAKVMEALCAVIGSSKLTYPIFIFDVVDRLKNWEKGDLVSFFGFFKSMVKQDNKAYLILSSSDDFFRVWLRDMFNPGQWEPFGVGCFPEAEARKFFASHSIGAAGGTLPATFQDSDWNDIYAVCGGSPLLLNQCARAAALNAISWKEAANALMRDSLCTVETGLAATKAAMGFSGEKYELICTEIVRNGFVGLKAVLASIYNGDKAVCKEEMLAMLSGNFIHVRYVTAVTAYGDVSLSDAGNEVDLAMARSPADRAAMKEALQL